MAVLKWLNEKGNVSVKVRDAVRSQVKAKLKSTLDDGFDAVLDNVNGGYSIELGTDASTGNEIYAHIDFTINMTAPDVKIERKKTAKKTVAEEVEVPSLF